MSRFGFLSPENARLVLEAARVLRNSGWTLPGQVPTPPRDVQTNLIAHNDSGSTIPAWACMQVTGTEDLGPITMLVVDQPADTDGTAGGFVFNGPNEIEADQDGAIQRGNIVRAYKNAGTVSGGQKWRPTVNQWYLTQDDAGQFTACGDDQVDDDVFKIFSSTESPGGRVFVTPSGGIAARSGATLGSATCTHYTVTGGTRASTSDTVTVYNDFTTAIGGSTDIVAIRVDGIWLAIAEDCA